MITLPKRYTTDVLDDDQLEFVAKKLPEPCAQTGRPAYTNLELLPGILKVLRSGCRWRDLDQEEYPSGITHWRRLRFWQKHQGFVHLWHYLLRILVRSAKLVVKTASIDGTLVPSFAFSDTTSYSGKHHKVGTKVSVVVAIPNLLEAMVRFGEIKITVRERKLLLLISASTIDRLLKTERKKLEIKGRSGTKPGSLLRNQIPVRIFTPWDEQVPGFVEIDYVAHCGETLADTYISSLDAVDIATCWTEKEGLYG